MTTPLEDAIARMGAAERQSDYLAEDLRTIAQMARDGRSALDIAERADRSLTSYTLYRQHVRGDA